MSWELKKLNELVLVKSGKRLPKGHSFITEPTNHLYIRARDIKNGKIKVESPVYINDETFNKISRYTVSENDVVITIVGANVGDIAIIDAKYDGVNLTENAAKLIPKNINELSPKFLKYSLFGDIQKSKFQQIAMAAAQPKLGFYKIKDFEINVPKIETQKRIADILSAYDYLIENNLKRIKLLEQAAQNIYKEWFVNLRFPGHENAVIIEETGLPMGWEEKKLSDYIDFKEGPGLRNWQFRTEGIPFLNIRMMSSGNLNFNSVKYLEIEEVERKYAHFLLKEFDHIVSTSGTLGKVVTIRKSHLPLCLNTSIIRFRPKQISIGKWYIKRKISSTEFLDEMRSFATGSAQLNFGPKHLNMMNIIVPMEKTGKEYERITNPMELKIISLLDYNQKLKAARDILLPRLMNRTIEV